MARPRSPTRLLPALLATLAALATCCGWASEARADAAQVTVVSPGGASQTLALSALGGSEDITGRPYALRSATGESSQAVTGFSLAKILDAAGADPYGFSYLEVQRPAGGSVVLSRHQALDPGAFADGPPAVYATATGTGFLRPRTGPEDLNASDSFEAPQGITVVLRKGTQLRVKAKASATKVEVGQKVSFSSTVEGAGAGEQFSYSWYFDDGHSAEGGRASHSFEKRGSYDVVLGVTTPGNDTGSSTVVTIQVGAAVAGGPNRKGGGTNQAAGAPDHGSADGPSTLAGTSPGTPSPGADADEGTVGRAPMDTQRGRRPRVQRGMSDRPPAASPRPSSTGDQIEGELLSSTSAAPPQTTPEQAGARTGNLEGNGGGGGVPAAAAGLLAALGLLGAGALIETGRVGRLLAAMRHKVDPGASA
ncbi:MAG TPA: PKD domain-containing protein [Solirubrobacterales bacterium]|nr:PKD domain-containing protein [Solirubrobacterales bacterium]